MDLIQSLKDLGNKAVEVATGPVKDMLALFFKRSVALERKYSAWYAAREAWRKAGKTFPHEATFQEMNAAVKKERDQRLFLVSTMLKLGANPADYGASLYGVPAATIRASIQGYAGQYDKPLSGDGLGFVPLVIGGAALAAVAALSSGIYSLLTRTDAIDLQKDLVEFYKAQGIPADKAVELARSESDKQREADAGSGMSGLFGNINKLAMIGLAGGALFVGLQFVKAKG